MSALIFFYMFSAVLLFSALMVIALRNPVHSALFLILALFNGAGLFLLAGAEFLAMILLIVYAGAVVVLFLFVILMLDIDVARLRAGMAAYLPVAAFAGVILLTELTAVFAAWSYSPEALRLRAAPWPDDVTNAEALGKILYTDYVYPFELAGLVLLAAMVGAIVLALHRREGPRRQDPARQTARRRGEAVRLVDVKPGQGL